MGKFMKKQVVVDAVQFLQSSESLAELYDFLEPVRSEVMCIQGDRHCRIAGCVNQIEHDPGSIETLKIPTNQGASAAIPGDWIIKGVNGEFYPCKPDLFSELYDKADVEDKADTEDLKEKSDTLKMFVHVFEADCLGKDARDMFHEDHSGEPGAAYARFDPETMVKDLYQYAAGSIDGMFTYQRPDAEQVESFSRITEAVKAAAHVINEECPVCEETGLAIQGLMAARMRANQAIATRPGKYHFKKRETGDGRREKEEGSEEIKDERLKMKDGGEEKHLLVRCGQILDLNGFGVTHHKYPGMTAIEDDFVIVDHVAGSVTFKLQYDTIGKVGVVGVQIDEGILFFQKLLRILNAEYPCRENINAINHIEKALGWLRERTLRRTKKGLEGTHAEEPQIEEKNLATDLTDEVGSEEIKD